LLIPKAKRANRVIMLAPQPIRPYQIASALHSIIFFLWPIAQSIKTPMMPRKYPNSTKPTLVALEKRSMKRGCFSGIEGKVPFAAFAMSVTLLSSACYFLCLRSSHANAPMPMAPATYFLLYLKKAFALVHPRFRAASSARATVFWPAACIIAIGSIWVSFHS